MRALTLTQPWAGLVAAGIKLVENRPRRMIKAEDFGKPFAIHASREIDEDVYERIYQIAPELNGTYGIAPWSKLSRITSAVVALATLDEIVFDDTGMLGGDIARALGDQHRWYFGPVGYVLRDVHVLATPVPCRGWQGFWTVSDDLADHVFKQLGQPALFPCGCSKHKVNFGRCDLYAPGEFPA